MRTTRISIDRSPLRSWWHVSLFDLSVNIKTVLRICFFHYPRVSQLLFLKLRNLLLTPQTTYHWLLLLRFSLRKCKWTTTNIVFRLASILLFLRFLDLSIKKVPPKLELFFKVLQILIGHIIVLNSLIIEHPFILSVLRFWIWFLKSSLHTNLFIRFLLLLLLNFHQLNQLHFLLYFCLLNLIHQKRFCSRRANHLNCGLNFGIVQTCQMICAHSVWYCESILFLLGERRRFLICLL